MAHSRGARSPGTGQAGRGVGGAALFLLTLLLGLAAPLALFLALWSAGRDVSGAGYILALTAVVLDIVIVLLAGLTRLRAPPAPRAPRTAYPPATALLLTTASDPPATVAETVRVLLRLPYLTPLQVIVLCATAEQEEAVAPLRDAGLVMLGAAEQSGMNRLRAALPAITGQFVGVFIAGEIPARDVFTRAWLWLSHGGDAVQGNRLLIDPGRSWVTQLAAVERAADGMAPTPLLMRWEEVDARCLSGTFLRMSFLRQLETGERAAPLYLARDRELVTRCPGPTTLGMLWSRQVQRELDLLGLPIGRSWRALGRSPLTRRQTLPLLHDLIWHQAYVWLVLQVLTISAFRTWAHGSLHSAGWAEPLIVLLALYAFGGTVVRTGLAALLAPAEVRGHPGWFVRYALLSILVQRGARHSAARIAQLRAIFGRRSELGAEQVAAARSRAAEWKVAPLTPPLSEPAREEVPLPVITTSGEGGPGANGSTAPAQLDTGDLPVLADEAGSGRGEPDLSEPPARPCPASEPSIFAALHGMQELVAELVRQSESEEARNRELRRRIDLLEGQLAGPRVDALQTLPPRGVSDEELQGMRESFGALAANPGSMRALASVPRHGPALARLVEEYNQMRRALAPHDGG